MKKMKRLAAAAMTLTLAGSLLCTVALAEEDPYVYELESYWSASTHAVGYEKDESGEEKVEGRECVVTFKLKDTSEEAEEPAAGEGAEATPAGEEPAGESDEKLYSAYCCDLETASILGSYYRMLNLEDSTYFDEETAAKIRGVVANGFAQDWTEEDLAAAQAAANAWLAAQGVEGVEGLTYAEALSATQAAIWSYANPSYSISPYHSTYPYISFSTYDHEEGYDDETWCKVEYEKEFAEGTNTKNNVERFYDFLINQQSKAPSTVLFSDNEFISSEAVFTENSLSYNVTMRVKLSGTVGGKDDLTLKATLGGKEQTFALTGENALVPDENGYYTITFNGISGEGADELTAQFALSGSQQVDDVYFFQAKPVDENAEDPARKSSQNLVGRAKGRAIVTASGEIGGIKLGTGDASLNKYDGSAESTTTPTGTNTVQGTDGNYYPSLSGVTFDLYAKDKDGVYHLIKTGLVSDANGNVYADGLSEDYEYFFRETGTNAGYILQDGYVKAGSVLANYRASSPETILPEDPAEEIDDDELPKAGADEEIIVDEEVPLVGMPNTGADSDTGLYLLITGVCAVMLAAVLLKKRRNA